MPVTNSKPFRLIIECGWLANRSYIWVFYRTDENGRRYEVGRGSFNTLVKMTDYLIRKNLICRICDICGNPYAPYSGKQRFCKSHSGTEVRNYYYNLKKEKKSNEIHEERPNTEVHINSNETQTDRSRESASSISVNSPSRDEGKPTIRLAGNRTLQISNSSGQNGHKPTNKTTDKDTEQTSGEICRSKTTPRSSEVKHVNGIYKCVRCATKCHYKGQSPFPKHCPSCRRDLERAEQGVEEKPRTFKMLQNLRNSEYRVKEIVEPKVLGKVLGGGKKFL